MMATGSSTVPLNEQLLTRTLMIVVGFKGGGGMNQQSLSSMGFAPFTVPHKV